MKTRKNLIIFFLVILILVLFNGGNTAEAAVRRVKLYDSSTFYPTYNNMEFQNWGNNIGNPGSTEAWFLTKVNLPNGARVKKLKLYAYDNYSKDVCLWLVWTKPRKAKWEDMNAELCSTGASPTAPRVFATTDLSPRIISNKDTTYHLVIRIRPGSLEHLHFWGAVIIYVK